MRAISEGFSIIIKDIFVSVLLIGYNYDALAFGYGEVIYATSCLMLSIITVAIKEGLRFEFLNFFPSRITMINKQVCWILPEYKQILKEMSKLSLLQCLLSECEKILIISLNKLTPEERSEYSFITNIGGLVVRIIYSPMEDSAYSYFAKLGGDIGVNKNLMMSEDLQVMCNVISLLSSVALFLIVFSYNYSYTVLKLLFSSTWSNPVYYLYRSQQQLCFIDLHMFCYSALLMA